MEARGQKSKLRIMIIRIINRNGKITIIEDSKMMEITTTEEITANATEAKVMKTEIIIIESFATIVEIKGKIANHDNSNKEIRTRTPISDFTTSMIISFISMSFARKNHHMTSRYICSLIRSRMSRITPREGADQVIILPIEYLKLRFKRS